MDGRFRLFKITAAVFALIVSGMPSTIQAAPMKKPTYTNKSRFRIPFQFDSEALQRMNAREVQLHVSSDHGENWELAQTLMPGGGKFEFKAPGEGEFWFAVKTLDGRNQLHPPRGVFETGLVVVIDQTQPQLELTAKQLSPGQMMVSWKVSDANLDVHSLKIEYQTSGSQNWETIAVAGRANGEYIWSVNQTGPVEFRGSVVDMAGNLGQANTQANVTAVGAGTEKQQPGRRVPIAMPETPPATENDQKLATGVEPNVDAAQSDNQMPIITPRGALPNYSQASQRLISNTRPIPTQTATQTAPQSPTQTQHERWPSAPVEQTPPVNPTSPTISVPGDQPIAAGQDSSRSIPLPAVNAPITVVNTPALPPTNGIQSPPAVPSQPTQATQPTYAPARQAIARRPGARERVVNTRRFQVNYKLDDIGPSGVSRVELFITEDNGRTWWTYGDDADLKSPFDVEVPHDGVYGFAIRVLSGAGLSTPAPASGEQPAIVVAVDQTPPTVELYPVQQGQGANANRILIRWKISEEHQSDRPISLYYAASLNGPWEPISGWREDSHGSFEWVVGPGVPTQFYVRVLARDSAGNVGKAETAQPIVVDLQRPTARIVDIDVVPGGPQ